MSHTKDPAKVHILSLLDYYRNAWLKEGNCLKLFLALFSKKMYLLLLYYFFALNLIIHLIIGSGWKNCILKSRAGIQRTRIAIRILAKTVDRFGERRISFPAAYGQKVKLDETKLRREAEGTWTRNHKRKRESFRFVSWSYDASSTQHHAYP